MENTSYRAIAIVGAGAIMPDAANVSAFWENVKNGRYSITRSTVTAGIRRFTSIPTIARRTRPIQRLADGCATTCGIR